MRDERCALIARNIADASEVANDNVGHIVAGDPLDAEDELACTRLHDCRDLELIVSLAAVSGENYPIAIGNLADPVSVGNALFVVIAVTLDRRAGLGEGLGQ